LFFTFRLDWHNFSDPSAACLLKEKNSLTLKQLFFFNAIFAGCVPVKDYEVFALKARTVKKMRKVK